MFGGFQEDGFRPGTENLPGIVGLGKASELRKNDLTRLAAYMKDLRDRFEAMVLDFVPGTRVNGDAKNRICNTTNIMFGGIDGRKLVRELDGAGVRCSQSSACTNFAGLALVRTVLDGAIGIRGVFKHPVQFFSREYF